jgi:hypothetical protein
VDEEVSNLLSYVFGFLVFFLKIRFLILQVCNDFVGENHCDIRVGVISVVSNGVVGGSMYFGFIKFPLLSHLENFLLTSLPGFLVLIVVLLLPL